VKIKRDDQSNNPEGQGVSTEDDPAVEEFCHLVATILVRILASKGQKAYNCSRSDAREASKQ